MSGEDNNVCHYATLNTPGISELTRLTLEAQERGWVFGGGHNNTTGELRGVFQVIDSKATYMPSIREAAGPLPDPVGEDEYVSVTTEESVGTLVVYEGKLGDTFRGICRQLIDLTATEQNDFEAKVIIFPTKI
jgi:hypothetical protein